MGSIIYLPPIMSKRRARAILRESWGQRKGFTKDQLEEIEWSTLPTDRSALDVLCRIGETLRPRDFVKKVVPDANGGPTTMVGREPGEDPARSYFANLPDE